MIEIPRPIFEIGSTTNYGQVYGHRYRFRPGKWLYELGNDCSPLTKSENDLELVEAALDLYPEPDFEIGQIIGSDRIVTGIVRHLDCTYSYYLTDGSDTPYVNWIHCSGMGKYLSNVKGPKSRDREHLDSSLISISYPENVAKADAWLKRQGL